MRLWLSLLLLVPMLAQAGTSGFTAPQLNQQRTDLIASGSGDNCCYQNGRGGGITAPAVRVSRPGFQSPTRYTGLDFSADANTVAYYDFSGSDCTDLVGGDEDLSVVAAGLAFIVETTVPGAVSTKIALDVDAAAETCAGAGDYADFDLATFSLGMLFRMTVHRATGMTFANFDGTGGYLMGANVSDANLTIFTNPGVPNQTVVIDIADVGWHTLSARYSTGAQTGYDIGDIEPFLDGMIGCEGSFRTGTCTNGTINAANTGTPSLGAVAGSSVESQAAYMIVSNRFWTQAEHCELAAFGPLGTGTVRGFQAPLEPTWRHSGVGC